MQNILQHLFKKNSLKEIPVDALQQFTREYPLFAVGHFLLAKKLQEVDDPGFTGQLQKTALYFHNPLWLEYKVNEQEKAGTEQQAEQITPPPADGQAEEPGVTRDVIEDVVLQQEKPVEPIPKATEEFEEEDPDATDGPEVHDPHSPEEDKLSFQAYHTVDYFASQGIKLSHEIKAEDKLGKQLKSFTEWLKTMRRLPQAVVEEVLEKTSDKEVEQYAAHSLEEKGEIVTEAMAEVLMKQGKTDKARELYHKLSLLNPHKSAYFAAKIEALNHH